jgi:hypothetical protein
MAIATKTDIAKEFLGEFPKASYKEFIDWAINHNVDSSEVLGNAYYRKLQKKAQEGTSAPEKAVEDSPVYEMRDNGRGFRTTTFKDRYGQECSLQKSSLASEDCVWLGVNDPTPKMYMAGEGWQNIPMPKGDVLLSGSMHLTREMVKTLLPSLKKFVKTGNI